MIKDVPSDRLVQKNWKKSWKIAWNYKILRKIQENQIFHNFEKSSDWINLKLTSLHSAHDFRQYDTSFIAKNWKKTENFDHQNSKIAIFFYFFSTFFEGKWLLILVPAWSPRHSLSNESFKICFTKKKNLRRLANFFA